MSLKLPADVEPFAEDYDQLTNPAVYALILDRPDDLGAQWDRHFDVRPPWFETFRDAETCVYVGAASNVLARLEDHRDGNVRQAALLQVCAIDRLHTVWFFADEDRAFERESGIATMLANERPHWYVHCR
jgi:predicted GIY-YIG superfamily endonuclease